MNPETKRTLGLAGLIGVGLAAAELARSPVQRQTTLANLDALTQRTGEFTKAMGDGAGVQHVTPGDFQVGPDRYIGKMVTLSGRIELASQGTYGVTEGSLTCSFCDVKFVSTSPLEGTSFTFRLFSHFGPPNPIGVDFSNGDSTLINGLQRISGENVTAIGTVGQMSDGSFVLAGMRFVEIEGRSLKVPNL